MDEGLTKELPAVSYLLSDGNNKGIEVLFYAKNETVALS